MTSIVRMQRANRGSPFRAVRLHGADPAQLDPFIGIDHAWMSAPTFPPHPHAGFSAVTYLFLDSETGMANRDSLGTRNLIEPGGLHWTAAGRGVVHEEVPAVTGSTTHLLQIFVNLPRDRQTAAPFALSLASQDVPVGNDPVHGCAFRWAASAACIRRLHRRPRSACWTSRWRLAPNSRFPCLPASVPSSCRSTAVRKSTAMAKVKLRASDCGSKARGSKTSRKPPRAARTVGQRASARRVGVTPVDDGVNRSSRVASRSRRNALLTAGWVMARRSAARVTLRSVITTSKTRNRLRSRVRKFMSEVRGVDVGVHSRTEWPDSDCELAQSTGKP